MLGPEKAAHLGRGGGSPKAFFPKGWRGGSVFMWGFPSVRRNVIIVPLLLIP